MAYQIAFDLYDSATQQFLGQVLQSLKASAPIPFEEKREKGEAAKPTEQTQKTFESLVNYFA